MLRKIREHDLLVTFRSFRGNQRWSVLTEPLWNIPHTLFMPFQSLYMSRLGLSSAQIGNTISLCLLLQVFTALAGGILTDKLGRRLGTLLSDFTAWVVPCALWAFARDYWWFLLAAAINSVQQIANTAWYCLYIEDCPPKDVTNAFTLTQMTGMLSVFFAPLAVWLVARFGVVPALRGIYLFSTFSMLAKVLLLYYFGEETRMGRQRLEETRGVSWWKLFCGYREVLLKILRSKRMLLVAALMALSNIYLIATDNFFSLYITQRLHLADSLVAVFPMVRIGIMLLFVIGLQNVFNRLGIRSSLLIGLGCYILSHVVLLLGSGWGLGAAGLYTLLEASAYAVIMPRRKALMALYVELRDRSRIFALYTAFMVAVSFPFGHLVGVLFELSPAYPFLFNIAIFLLTAVLVATSADLKKLRSELGEQKPAQP